MTSRSLRNYQPSVRPAVLDHSISAAARASGVSAKMIRHYERIGLIQPAARSTSNYRSYDQQDIQILHFIGRARSVGFSLEEIAQLLALWREPARSSADVKVVALQHLANMKRRIAALRAMIAGLEQLAQLCPGDDRPACPILDDLAEQHHPKSEPSGGEP